MMKADAELVAATIELPEPLPTVLGMGAHQKASLCLIMGNKAFVSQTAGDMEMLDAVEHYRWMLDAMIDKAGGADKIRAAGHDWHPDFYSSRQANMLACLKLPVQHHHAHVLASAMEHHHVGPVLGLVLDGFGLGLDNQSWGGELLRLAHLALLAQPGGDIAARQPWRMGAAALYALGRGDEIGKRFAEQANSQMLATILDKNINCPKTSSCGRLFDAACGLLNVCPMAEFEGEAPMQLEAMVTAPETLDGGWKIRNDGTLDLSGLLDVLAGMNARDGANMFHGTLSAALADWVRLASVRTGITSIAFGGGCFLNKVMTGLVREKLEDSGIRVLFPEKLSPGDAGLSFGQAWAAGLAATNREN